MAYPFLLETNHSSNRSSSTMLTFWKAHLNTCQTLDCVIKSHILDHCEYYQTDISKRVQIPLDTPQKKNHCFKF